MKKIIIIAVITLLAIASGIYAYNEYTSSPAYSVKQLKKAIENKDWTAFSKYVNVEDISSNLFDMVKEQATKDDDSGLGAGFAELMRGNMEEAISDGFKKAVESGKMAQADLFKETDYSEKAGSEILFDDISFEKDGKIATMKLPTYEPRYDTSLVISLRRRDVGDHYELFDVSGFFTYAQHLYDLESQLVQKRRADQLERLQSLLQVSEVKIETYYPYRYLRSITEQRAVVTLKNVGNKTVKSVDFDFSLQTINGDYVAFDELSGKVDCKPGEVINFTVDIIGTAPTKKGYVELSFNRYKFTFDDGTVIKSPTFWQELPAG